MKNLKKISRDSLRSISGGAPGVPVLLCHAPKEQVRCVDPYSGEVSWQCTSFGHPGLCLVLTPK